MKRRKLVLTLLACLLVLGAAGALLAAGRRPFRGLEGADIASATVWLTPPDVTVAVPDTEALAALLREAVVYRRDDSYVEYTGQGVVYTVRLADGTTREITAFSPFLIVDGVGYRTKHEPCEALNRYANELLQADDAAFVLASPPAGWVYSGTGSVGGVLGTYSWRTREADGSVTSAEADSPHPLDCRELLAGLDTESAEAEFQWAVPPDELVSVRCWPDSRWGDTTAESTAVPAAGTAVSLRPGGWIYEVEARWEDRGYGGGTARYLFYIVRA